MVKLYEGLPNESKPVKGKGKKSVMAESDSEPVKHKKQRPPMSDEQKAKLAAGRAAKKAANEAGFETVKQHTVHLEQLAAEASSEKKRIAKEKREARKAEKLVQALKESPKEIQEKKSSPVPASDSGVSVEAPEKKKRKKKVVVEEESSEEEIAVQVKKPKKPKVEKVKINKEDKVLKARVKAEVAHQINGMASRIFPGRVL